MICFDREIYLKKAVEQACKDYRRLADIELKEIGKQIICEIKHTEEEQGLIVDEFCNYVLSLTVMMSGGEI